LDKPSEIVVKIFKGEKSRSVGMIELNLAEFINAGEGN
jgi:hypothetical protein